MINPEQIASNPVTINGFMIERQALDDMDQELKQYFSVQDRLAYLRKRLPLITQESAAPADGMPRGSNVSNPTLAKVEKIEQIEQEIGVKTAWLEGVEGVRKRLPPAQQGVANHMYFLPYEERETNMSQLAKRLHIGRTELYRTRDEALLEFWLVLKD